MSFSMTTAQMYARSKWVTRRSGWWFLPEGAVLQAIERGQGLKRGEVVVPICRIRVLHVRVEALGELLRDPLGYGREEMRLEGFPGRPPEDFVAAWLARLPRRARRLTLPVCRIHFDYV